MRHRANATDVTLLRAWITHGRVRDTTDSRKGLQTPAPTATATQYCRCSHVWSNSSIGLINTESQVKIVPTVRKMNQTSSCERDKQRMRNLDVDQRLLLECIPCRLKAFFEIIGELDHRMLSRGRKHSKQPVHLSRLSTERERGGIAT